jgi:hypothetical protein
MFAAIKRRRYLGVFGVADAVGVHKGEQRTVLGRNGSDGAGVETSGRRKFERVLAKNL